MRGSFSKSDGYKKILRCNSVISAPLCSWIFLSVLISYRKTAPGSTLWIAVFAILTVVSALLVYRRYSVVLQRTAHKISAAFIFILLLLLLFIWIHGKTAALLDRSMMPAEISNFIAFVEKVETGRYSSDVYFTTEYRPGLKAEGVLRYNGDYPPLPGSMIAVHRKAPLISSQENGYLSGLAREGISYRCIVDESDITIIEQGRPSWRKNIKEKIVKRIYACFPGNEAGLIIAVYFGDTTHLPKKIMLNFRDAGVLHVLAASGMNIALVASIPLLLIPVGVGRRKALIISLLFAAAYLFITDMPVSLVRAAAMYLFVIINLVIYRERNSFNALYLAGSLMILLHPWDIFNPGFQLSFGATAGIMLFYRRYMESLKMFPRIIAGSLAVTFSAQVFAYPIIYLHMNQFNTVGFITNLAIIPLVTAAAMLSLAVLGLSFISPAAALFSGKYTGVLCSLIFYANEFASSLRLNFYTDDWYIITAALLLMAMPLVNIKVFNIVKSAPVFAALLISTLMLKNIQKNMVPCACANTGHEGVNLYQEKAGYRLTLDLGKNKTLDEQTLLLIRKKNPDIKIIEIYDTSYHNNTAFRMLLNDFAVEECVINNITIDGNFKNFILMLRKENIKVTFRFNS